MRNRFTYLALALALTSCSTDSSTDVESVDWCNTITYGTFEGKTKDGIKAVLILEQINEHPYYDESDGFFLTYELPNGKSVTVEGGEKIMAFMQFNGSSMDIKKGKPISLNPYGLSSEEDYLSDSDFELEDIRITYYSGSEIKLEFGNIQGAINDLTSSSFGDEMNSIVLAKVIGVSDCYDFDPMISYNKFTNDEVDFITSLTEIGETPYVLAKKELMMDFMLRMPKREAYGAWNESLKEHGSIFRLDFNGDDANDICGYFSSRQDSEEKLVFKIFLNNGASFSEVYSKNLTNYRGGDEILAPGKKNGSDIIEGLYMDEGGYYLFYNRLNQEIEQIYYD